MMDAIPFLSVCSGIGAPEVAWGPAGMESVLVSEIEEFPRAVLAHRHGARPEGEWHAGGGPVLWGDFTTVSPAELRRLGVKLPRVLVGGTPCQSFSVAGKRGSLSDPRGNLSLSFVRLAHDLADEIAGAERAAGDAGPVFFAVWENVPGVLSTADNAFGCFLGAIVGGDAAFDLPRGVERWPDAGMVAGPRARAAWRVLDAQHFRVPQRRRRVIVVVGFGAGADPAEVLLEPEGLRGDPAAGGGAAEDLAGTLAGGARGGGGYSLDDVPVIAGTLDASMGRCRGAGTNPAALAFGVDSLDDTLMAIAKPVLAGGHANNPMDENLVLVEAYGGAHLQGSIDVAMALLGAKPGSRYDFESETFIAHTPRGEGFDASEDGTGRGVPLVPIAFNAREDPECTGDVAGSLDCSSPQAQAIAFTVSQNANGFAWESDVHPTLQARVETPTSNQASGVLGPFGVRRLTPRECERLQSFPDDFTLIPWRGRPADACPDGPRYRALGNSMNVEMMAWLGRRLAAAIRRADG